jgi:hypothetical protein
MASLVPAVRWICFRQSTLGLRPITNEQGRQNLTRFVSGTELTTPKGLGTMNFFGWLREGVRQSILLGVNDAVEQLGGEEHPELRQRLMANLSTENQVITQQKTNATSRRRLGRSLRELQPEQPKS